MPSIAAIRILSAVLTVGLFCAGCAHPTYSPYGYGAGPMYGPNYGPTYPAPSYMGPGVGPTYVPQTLSPSSGSPTPLTNPSGNNNPLNLRTNPSSPSDTDAPSFNPNPPNTGNKLVPPGQDPDLDLLNNSKPGASLPAGNINTAKLPAFERGGLAAAAPPVVADIVQTGAAAEPDPFEAPSRLPTDPAANPMGEAVPENSPYQYDGQDYKWLKGVLDYDPLTKTWSIIYSLTPNPKDKHGGSFVLGAHPDLGALQTGDIVLLEGVIDPLAKDSTGRPIYTVTKVTGPLAGPDAR